MIPTKRSGLAYTSLSLSILLLLAGYLSSLSAVPARATTTAPFTSSGAQLISVGKGATAWADYDSDGDPDLLLSGQMKTTNNVYENITKLYRNTQGTFSDSGAQLPGVIDGLATWGDYDQDGDPDLLLAGHLVFRIYRNDGGKLVDIGAEIDWLGGAAAAWNDYDHDGDLDFIFSGTAYGQFITKLYRNDGGVFVDSGAVFPGMVRASFAWGDYDNDGDDDLFMHGYAGNATIITRLYRNQQGVFSDTAIPFPAIQDGSAAWGDYDQDGDLDLLLTGDRLYEYVSRIYRNTNGSFTNINAGLPGIVYGQATWVDYDRDGDLDVHLNGQVPGSSLNEIYRNEAGVFSAIHAGLPIFPRTGSLWADYDLDRRPDVVAMHRLGDGTYVNQVYRNMTQPGSGVTPTVTPIITPTSPTTRTPTSVPTTTPTPGPTDTATPPTACAPASGSPQTPRSISLLSRFGGTDTPNSYIGDVKLQSTRIYLGTNRGVQVLDGTNPSAPKLLTTNSNFAWSANIEVSGTTAYLNGYNYGLATFDVTDVTQPRQIGGFTTMGSLSTMNLADRLVYVGDGSGLIVLDVGDLTTPREIGRYNMDGSPQDTEVCSSIAYVAAGNAGLHIVNVQNPASPRRLGVAGGVWAAAVETVGNVAYVAGVRGGLFLYDVSVPSNPVLLGQYDTPGDAIDVQVVGNNAFVADRGNGLLILDVSDPRNPVLRAQYAAGWSAKHVQVVGDLVYVAAEGDGLHILRLNEAADTTPTDVLPITPTPTHATTTPTDVLPITPTPTPAITTTPTMPPSFPGGCSLSINNGAPYAGQRGVQLWLDVAGAAYMQLSNDGGFAQAPWVPYEPRVDWVLSNPGARIATLVVYSRFVNAQGTALCGGANISDDIIYDPLPPKVSASVNTASAANRTSAETAPTRLLRIVAEDQAGGSGVAHMRIATNTMFAGVNWQPFSATGQITAGANETIYVQVRDAADNLSAVMQAVPHYQVHLPLVGYR